MKENGKLNLKFPYSMIDQNNGFNESFNLNEIIDLKVISSQQLLDLYEIQNMKLEEIEA